MLKSKWTILVLLQVIVSLLAGIFLSKMSLIGRIGVSTLYTEYSFLKFWYKGFAYILIVQLLLIAILWIVKRFTTYKNFTLVNLIFIILGLIGLLYTFYDFTQTSHKYMNTQFHTGGYLFWAGWFITCLFFFFARVKPKPIDLTINTQSTQEETSTDEIQQQ